jgi:hypothetical protein
VLADSLNEIPARLLPLPKRILTLPPIRVAVVVLRVMQSYNKDLAAGLNQDESFWIVLIEIGNYKRDFAGILRNALADELTQPNPQRVYDRIKHSLLLRDRGIITGRTVSRDRQFGLDNPG